LISMKFRWSSVQDVDGVSTLPRPLTLDVLCMLQDSQSGSNKDRTAKSLQGRENIRWMKKSAKRGSKTS
jgi:hypothetical protein